MKRQILITLLLTLICSSQSYGQEPYGTECKNNEIVLIDNARYVDTTTRASSLLSRYNKPTQTRLYTGIAKYSSEELKIDIEKFAREISLLKPKIIIIHYSTFEQQGHSRSMENFVVPLESELKKNQATKPIYIVYSASFRYFSKDMKELFEFGAPFETVGTERTHPLPLQVNRGRFTRGRGDQDLAKFAEEAAIVICAKPPA